MDTGSVIALVFGSITVLGGAVTGAIYIGKLIAAIDRTNERNAELAGIVGELRLMLSDHARRLSALEERE